METKDIYVITNLVNGKQYVGQAKNAMQRFKAHLSARDDTVLHKAILKYGKNNFNLQILESQIVNYNEREQYWIKKLETMCPFGYNMTEGGEGYPHFKGVLCYQSSINENELEEIIKLLKETSLSQTEIGERFNISQSIISNINIGKTYHKDDIIYPIRPLENDSVKEVKILLEHTCLSLNQISKKTGVDKSTVNEINQGRSFIEQNRVYPIRKEKNISKLSDPVILQQIFILLKDGKISTQKIAEKFDVKRFAIEDINNGKSHYNPNWNYPIRKKPATYHKVTDCEVDEIIKLLKESNLSFREIARKYNLKTHNAICYINNGKSISYRRNNIDYPIRKRY